MKLIAASLVFVFAAYATPVSSAAKLTGRPIGMRDAKLSDFNFSLPRDEQAACGYLGQNGKDSGKPADCDRLSEVEYYSGIWLEDRETSFFSFAVKKTCWDDHKLAECVELEMTAQQQSKIPGHLWECTKKYRLEFIGRHTMRPARAPGGYPSHVIVVDRIISAKLLGPAEPAHNICGPD